MTLISVLGGYWNEYGTSNRKLKLDFTCKVPPPFDVLYHLINYVD